MLNKLIISYINTKNSECLCQTSSGDTFVGKPTTLFFYRVGSVDPTDYNGIHWMMHGFGESKEEAKRILHSSGYSLNDKKVKLMAINAWEVLDSDVGRGGLNRDLREVYNNQEELQRYYNVMLGRSEK